MLDEPKPSDAAGLLFANSGFEDANEDLLDSLVDLVLDCCIRLLELVGAAQLLFPNAEFEGLNDWVDCDIPEETLLGPKLFDCGWFVVLEELLAADDEALLVRNGEFEGLND